MTVRRIPEPTLIKDASVNSYLNQMLRVIKINFNDIDDFLKSFFTNRFRREAMFYDTSITGATITDIDPDIYFHLVSPLSNTTVALRDPTEATSIGKTVVIKRNYGGAATMEVLDIEGGYDVNLPAQNDYLMLYCNGSDWFIISERIT